MEGERHVSVSLQCEVIKVVVEIAEGRLSRGCGLSPQGMPLAFQPLKRTRAKGREVNAQQLLQDFRKFRLHSSLFLNAWLILLPLCLVAISSCTEFSQ